MKNHPSRGGLFAMLALATSATALPARAAESYDACVGFIDSVPTVLTSKGVWCLRKDLTTAQIDGAAITIDANNVSVDCNGFRLGGLAAGPETEAVGIDGKPRLNAVVRGCNVRGFLVGIRLQENGAGDGGHVVEDNRLDGNTLVGITVAGHGSVVRRNLVRDTGGSPVSETSFALVTTGTVFVDDNVVAGVVPGEGGSSAWGLFSIGNVGGAIRRNLITGVHSTSGASVVTILAGTRAWLEGNRIVGSNILGSVGLTCSDATTRPTHNSITGFGDNETGCSRPAVDTNDIP